MDEFISVSPKSNHSSVTDFKPNEYWTPQYGQVKQVSPKVVEISRPYWNGPNPINQPTTENHIEYKGILFSLDTQNEGESLQCVVTNDPRLPNTASFDVGGFFTFGPETNNQIIKRAIVFDSLFMHENGHRQYSLLPGNLQKEINDHFLKQEDLIIRFAQMIYRDPYMVVEDQTAGENYLHVHGLHKNDPEGLKIALASPHYLDSRDIARVKDYRAINIPTYEPVILGHLVGEALSYCSPHVLRDYGGAKYHRIVEEVEAESTERRGGSFDDRYKITGEMYQYFRKQDPHFVDDLVTDKYSIFPDSIINSLDQYREVIKKKFEELSTKK